MDQIYIPKNRTGMDIGEYVVVSSLESGIETEKQFKPYFYGLKNIEPIKLEVIKRIFSMIAIKNDNIIITGSFLDKGFMFNDIDILIIREEELNADAIKRKISSLGIKPHLIILSRNAIIQGLSTDPLYNLMLSRCISRKRIIYKTERKINFKLLDLNLLRSKSLIDNFDILGGNEKYYLTLNLISLFLFVKGKRLSYENINREIEKIFMVSPKKIKENLIGKDFMQKFHKSYDKTFNLIMEGIKNEQKQTD